jgi:hypothetical protein
MAGFSFKRFFQGINIVPKATTTASGAGDLEFVTSSNKLNLHNGSTISPIVTESHTATLTNKTIDISNNTVGGLTVSKAMVTTAGGLLSTSATTATEIGYVAGVTSAIQTQINLKSPIASPTFTGILTTPVANVGTGLMTHAGTLKVSEPDQTTTPGISLRSGNLRIQMQAGVDYATGSAVASTTTNTISSTGASSYDLAFTRGNSELFRINATGAAFNGSTVTFTRAANNYNLSQGASDGALFVNGDSNLAAGAGILLYGGSHASFANVTKFINTNATVGTISSAGLWTLGASGGTQTHVVNGALTTSKLITASGATGTYIDVTQTGTVGTNADPQFRLRDASGTAAAFGYSNSAATDLFITNGRVGGLLFSANSIIGGQLSAGGAWTIGASAATVSHTINGTLAPQRGIDFGTATNTGIGGAGLKAGAASRAGGWDYPLLGIYDGSKTDGTYLGSFGASGSGTLSTALTSFYLNPIDTTGATGAPFKVSSAGIVTLGASSGTQTHVVNGNLTVSSTGTIGIGTTAQTGRGIVISSTGLAGTDQMGILSNLTGNSSSTGSVNGFFSTPNTAASAFTTAALCGYTAGTMTKGAGSTVTRAMAYYGVAPTVGTNNAFLTDNTGFTGDWFINQSGTTASTLGGALTVGGALSVTGTTTVAGLKRSGGATYLLPTTDGATGTFLKTDGSGNLSFAAPTITNTVDNSTINLNGSSQLQIKPAGITGTQVSNNINLPGDTVQANSKNVVVSNTNTTKGLAIVRANVTGSSGAVTSGEGVTFTNTGTGQITFTFSTAFGDVPTIHVTSTSPGTTGAAGLPYSFTSFVYNLSTSGGKITLIENGAYSNASFSFVAIGQKA